MNYLLTLVFVSVLALFLFRYEFEVSQKDFANVSIGVLRYDRWTGGIAYCARGIENDELRVNCVPIGD